MKISQLKLQLFSTLLILVLSGCSSGSSNSGSGSAFQNRIYFVSQRSTPLNFNLDGDIFSVDTTHPGDFRNLTGSANDGDDNDYACAVDLFSGRNRLFFVSERTDINNPTGDVDIFTVPLFGGLITNVTGTTDPGDADDSCLGIVPSTGSVVFESARTDEENPDGDVDIFVATLTTNPANGQITGALLSNRTAEKTGNSAVADKLVYIGSHFLYFESTRDEPDDSASAFVNTNGDQHIFRVNATGTRVIENLTTDFEAPPATGSPTATNQDIFCGINPDETLLAFQSTRQEGSGPGGLQIGTGAGTGVQDVFVRDLALPETDAGGGVNTAIGNLTDAAARGTFAADTVPEDADDICFFGRGTNAVVRADGVDHVLFVSPRTGAGTHRTDGNGTGTSTLSQLTNASTQNDAGDLFSSTLSGTPVGGVLNTIVNLSDGTAGDDLDTEVGICGDHVIFASKRTDLAPGSSGNEDDLYSVAVTGGAIVNHTNGTAGDDNDVFLCCNSHNNRLAWASKRTDVDNAAGDIDIFTSTLSSTPGDIQNVTNADNAKDTDDVFGAITGPLGDLTLLTAPPMPGSTALIGRYANTTILPTGIPAVPAGGFDIPLTGGPYQTPTFNHIPVACTSTDYIVFASTRRIPKNSETGDLDLFAVPFLSANGSPSTIDDLINLTDTPNKEADANDGLTAVEQQVFPRTLQ